MAEHSLGLRCSGGFEEHAWTSRERLRASFEEGWGFSSSSGRFRLRSKILASLVGEFLLGDVKRARFGVVFLEKDEKVRADGPAKKVCK